MKNRFNIFDYSNNDRMMPAIPVMPQEPGYPVPSKPVVPEMPEMPIPSKPVAPKMPEMPIPSKPAVPEMPEMPVPSKPVTPEMPDLNEPSNVKEYVVKRGDSLYRIAKNNNTTVQDLMDINELTSTLIFPNQVLVIPRNISTGGMFFEEYEIMPNDTLQSISKNANVNMIDIQKYNDISKLILQEGQVIRIPRGMIRYVVKPNDTIDEILSKTSLDPMQLIRANGRVWFRPGTTITL